ASGADDGEPAGLPPVGGDLRNDLAGCDAERARERGGAADGRLDRLGHAPGGEEVVRDLTQVQVALVQPRALDGRDDLADRGPDGLRVLAVERVAGPYEDGVGTAAERLPAAHRRVDAEGAGDVVRGRNHAAAVRVAAHDQRRAAEARILELLDRGVERIQVEVRDDHRS